MKKSLKPTLTYVLSILGLLCCCIGGLGVLLSGPAALIAHNKIKAAQLDPDAYKGTTKALETAKIIAIIITVINALYLILTIYQISTGDFMEEFQREYQKAMEEMQQTT